MDRAIVTISIGDNYQQLAKITHPTIKSYAEKVKADFIILDHQVISQTSPHFEKFQIFNLLNKYRRILYIDTDVIIREDCPDLFKLVPESKLGIFNEGLYQDHSQELSLSSQQYNIPLRKGWNKYYNTGVMVISRIHKELFRKPKHEIWNFFEQSYLNLIIMRDKYEIHELDYKFNRITKVDQIGEHRLASYIIHYAGVINNLSNLISADIQKWQEKKHLEIKRSVVIGVGVKLGDTVCAEPVVRFAIEKAFPDADISLVAQYPDVFRHLQDKVKKIQTFEEFKLQSKKEPDMPHYFLNVMAEDDHIFKTQLDNTKMNTTTWMSLLCFGRDLTDKDKQIKLEVSSEGTTEFLNAIKNKTEKLVLIHPGRGWPSKTFPIEWWNEVIKSISAEYNVAIIGKDDQYGGVLKVETSQAQDLRNILSTSGLIAAISQCSVLISNDTAPVHISGAFDNWIILLPSCKHADFILPYRDGNKYHKAIALCKKYSYSDKSDPMQRIDKEIITRPADLDGLPTPQEVYQTLKSLPSQ